MALILLAGAGLLIRSLKQLQRTDPGFDASNILTMSVTLPLSQYSNVNQRIDFCQRLIDHLRRIPGTLSASAINNLPFSETDTIALLFDVVGQPPAGKFEDRFADNLVITPDYFETMRIPLLQGRSFTEQDTKGSQRVVIINQSLASRYWYDGSPIGKRIKIASEQTPCEIVGLVGDVKHFGLESKTPAEMYSPYLQSVSPLTTFVIRVHRNPSDMIGTMRNEIQNLDRTLPVYDIKTMDERLYESLSQRRFVTFVLSIFSTVALLLAIGGIYSVMAYFVSQRRYEIGMRMALGAQRNQVFKLVLKNGFYLALKGAIIGLPCAIGLTRLMSSLLYNLEATDPLTFIVTTLALVATAMLPSLLPAYRAMKVNPIVVLREE